MAWVVSLELAVAFRQLVDVLFAEVVDRERALVVVVLALGLVSPVKAFSSCSG